MQELTSSLYIIGIILGIAFLVYQVMKYQYRRKINRLLAEDIVRSTKGYRSTETLPEPKQKINGVSLGVKNRSTKLNRKK